MAVPNSTTPNSTTVHPDDVSFLDRVLLSACDAGIRQAVFLGSDLDPRPYTAPWPAGMTVFVIDRPGMLALKIQALAGLGVTPTATVRPVAMQDELHWRTPLQQSGFDHSRPTIWSVEGELPFLEPRTRQRALDALTVLSTEGSRLVTADSQDRLPNFFDGAPGRSTGRHARWSHHPATSTFGIAGDLRSRGWAVQHTEVRLDLPCDAKPGGREVLVSTSQTYLTATLSSGHVAMR